MASHSVGICSVIKSTHWSKRVFKWPCPISVDTVAVIGRRPLPIIIFANSFRGPLNWYRNIPTNNAITPELESKRFTQPAAFVAGAADDMLLYDPNWRASFPNAFDDLRFIEIIEGAGHWVQMEKPQETTAQILRFLQGL